MPQKGQITCEHCGNTVPEDNINRTCVAQLDEKDCFNLDLTNVPSCNCCDKCRENCKTGYYEERTDNKA